MPVTQDQRLTAATIEPASAPTRTLYITGQVNDVMAHEVIVALEQLDRTDGDIRIVINSEGGSELDGYAIYDAITMCRNRVIIDGYGYVASIAAAIFQAGDYRRLTPNCQYMIHNGSVNDLDPTMPQDKLVALSDEIKAGAQRYYDILAFASTQAQEQIEEWCNKETTFNAVDAVAAGFADAVIEPVKTKVPKPAPKKRKKRK